MRVGYLHDIWLARIHHTWLGYITHGWPFLFYGCHNTPLNLYNSGLSHTMFLRRMDNQTALAITKKHVGLKTNDIIR